MFSGQRCSWAARPPRQTRGRQPVCFAPQCGDGYEVTAEGVDDDDSIYGWNVHLTGAADEDKMREIADLLAATREGRRFVMFYTQPAIGFELAPNSISAPLHPFDDASFIASFDYRNDDEPLVAGVPN